MLRAILTVATSVAALAAGVSDSPARSSAPTAASCPVTLPNGDGPPNWIRWFGRDPRMHGNGKLWTWLSADGIWRFDPNDKQDDGTYFDKYGWLTESRERLSVSARRLDAPSPPARIRVNGPGWFSGIPAQPAYSYFAATWWPATGCWEITGRVGGTTLKVVAIVVDGVGWTAG
jgi:hypothetical protein